MLSAFHLLGVHSFLVLAFGVLLVIAVLHVSVASGPSAMTDNNGWTSDLFYDRSAARTPRGAVAPLLPLWGTSSSQLADRKSLHRSQKTQKLEFVGKYASLRRSLDYTYHAHYPTSRQLFQDSIIDAILNETNIIDEDGNTCTGTDRPWIVYTAGAMGAGKSYTIRQLAANQRFPLHSFVRVDYDAVRKHLPEFQLYIQQSPEHAGEWTRKEAGYIAELATQAALQRSHNVLVDGSLRDSTWFKKYFSQLRRHHPHLRIGILHVTAPPDAVFQRAEVRAIGSAMLHAFIFACTTGN
jgi:predicted kinase